MADADLEGPGPARRAGIAAGSDSAQPMPRWRPGKRLSVFIGEYDRYHHHSLADAILERAREEGLAGATILRGIEGFGSSGHLKTARLLSSSDDLPIVIEIVDDAHRIERFIPILDRMIKEGLVTVEDADIHFYGGVEAHPLDDDQPSD